MSHTICILPEYNNSTAHWRGRLPNVKKQTVKKKNEKLWRQNFYMQNRHCRTSGPLFYRFKRGRPFIATDRSITFNGPKTNHLCCSAFFLRFTPSHVTVNSRLFSFTYQMPKMLNGGALYRKEKNSFVTHIPEHKVHIPVWPAYFNI